MGSAKNYKDVHTTIRKKIDEMHKQGIIRIGFVSGRIGNRHETDQILKKKSIKDDMDKMRKYTEYLRLKYGLPVFSSTNIFDTVWKELDETNLPPTQRSKEMKKLFRMILKSGVTDVYMMDGWEDAPGAIDEKTTAESLGLTIHNPEPIQI